MSGKGRRMRGGGAVGQTLPLVVIFMMSLLLAAGLTIDIGNAYRVKQSLQASADAAVRRGCGQPAEPGRRRRRGQLVRLRAGRQEPHPGRPDRSRSRRPRTARRGRSSATRRTRCR